MVFLGLLRRRAVWGALLGAGVSQCGVAGEAAAAGALIGAGKGGSAEAGGGQERERAGPRALRGFFAVDS